MLHDKSHSMNKLIIIAFFSLFPLKVISQTKEIINPKGKWYFGAEIGQNLITSYSFGENKKSLQVGILSEYYFARHWSLSGRIKYYETGVSFFTPSTHTGSLIDLGSDESFGSFSGAVISIPLDIKWEFRVYKNLAGSFKLGYVYNFETKSKYGAYSEGVNTDFPKQFSGINAGYGFNYFINKKYAVYLDIEAFGGGSKGHSNGFLYDSYHITENSLISIGCKYTFKEEKQ